MPSPQFLDQLLNLPMVGAALLSPDRHWVAFEWDKRHPNQDVFLISTTDSTPPRALTHTPEATRLVRWAPDSQSVILEEDQAGDERVTLYRVFLDQPGYLHRLTEDHPAYFVRGGGLSPEGNFLYYGANYDFRSQKLIGPTAIYRQELATGERVPLVFPRKPAYTVPELNLAGTHLLYARKDRHSAGRQFHLLDVMSGEDREILNFGDSVKVFARWFPDGRNILVISEGTGQGPQQHISLGVYHWPTNSLRWLIDDPDRNIESAWVTPDGIVIVDEIGQAGHLPICLDVNTREETPFPEVRGNLLPLGRAVDGSWIARYYSAVSMVDLVRLLNWPP
jgi:Tol biopolymer transport system component